MEIVLLTFMVIATLKITYFIRKHKNLENGK
jgi:hypothetical protein